MQKTITTDFIEKTRIKNDGSVPQYYVTGSQEAIIPRDLFTQVQEELLRRSNMYSNGGKRKRIYSSKYALSSICTCTKCGDIYRCIAWNNRGKRSNVWRCCTRVEHGPDACDAPTIGEEELQQATVKAINLLVRCSSSMKIVLLQNIEAAIADDNTGELEEYLIEANEELIEYDEPMVRKYIQEIKIYEDRFKVCFKAGIELDIPR